MLDFSIVSIRKSNPPQEFMDDDVWHQYIIANEITTISGVRKGSIKEVTSYVQNCVQRLNMRFQAYPKQTVLDS
jgi:hypothetical protein